MKNPRHFNPERLSGPYWVDCGEFQIPVVFHAGFVSTYATLHLGGGILGLGLNTAPSISTAVFERVVGRSIFSEVLLRGGDRRYYREQLARLGCTHIPEEWR